VSRAARRTKSDCQCSYGCNAGKRVRKTPGIFLRHATKRVDRNPHGTRDEASAQRFERGAARMALRGKQAREKHGVGTVQRGAKNFAKRVRGDAEAEARIMRTPVKRLSRARGGKMQSVRAEARRKRRIAGDKNDEIAAARDVQKFLGQHRTTLRVPGASNDETAAWQGTRGFGRIGQSLVIRHQRKRRPCAGSSARRVEARGSPC